MAMAEPLLDRLEQGAEQGDNPFVNKTHGKPLSAGAKLRRYIIMFTLAPVRIFLVIIIFLAAWLLATLATLGLKQEDYHALSGRPLSTIRWLVCWPIFPLSRCLLFVLGFWRIRVRGRRASFSEAPILVSNHVSGLIEGTFLLGCAKLAEMSYVQDPVMRPIMLATQCILVDRSDPNSRDMAKGALQRRSREPGWPQTLVFPEGTVTNGSALVQFKLGAFSAGCPVQPVVFRYSYENHDPSFTFPIRGGPDYLGGLITQFANHLEVSYLDVYTPSDEERSTPSLYASNVRKLMAEALKVETTKHSAEDVALCLAAQRHGLPHTAGVVEWETVTESLSGFRVRDAMELLKEFATIDKTSTGRVDFPTFRDAVHRKTERRSSRTSSASNTSGGGGAAFARSLSLTSAFAPPSGGLGLGDEDHNLRTIFDLLDAKGDGYVDFQEYLCGVAVLNGQGQDGVRDSLGMIFDCLVHGEAEVELSREQLDRLMLRAAPDTGRERLDELFREADQDQNGTVSREEFLAFFTGHQDDMPLHAAKLFPGLRGLKAPE